MQTDSPTEVTTIGLDDKGHKHTGNIVGMLWSATNEHLLTCSDDCTIRKWDVEVREALTVWQRARAGRAECAAAHCNSCVRV